MPVILTADDGRALLLEGNTTALVLDVAVPPNVELREDGSYELREDAGYELRE